MADETWSLAVVIAIVVVGTVIASFGFHSMSENPIVPTEVEVNVEEAPNVEQVNTSNTARVLSITNTGSKAVPLSEVEIVAGSRAYGLEFNRSANWTDAVGEFSYEVYLGRTRLRNASSAPMFEPGDTLWIVKTTEKPLLISAQIPVRLFHRPSHTVIASDSTTVNASASE